MAGYNEIRGLRVKYLSADPSNAENGQVWYNSTSGNLRVQGIGVGAWSSGSSMISARYRAGGAGTQTAGLAFGGSTGNPGAQPSTTATEEYNGSGWSTGGNLNEARRGLGGAGTQIAGLAFAGSPSPSDSNTTNLTEEYNGSSWTAVNTMNTARQTFMGAGTQTAAFAAGGVVPPGYTNTNASEVYDGTNWTASPGTIGTASRQGAASGTSTAGLIFGGGTSPSALITTTQTFDGSTYTTVNSMNTARRGLAGSGTQTAAIAFGGATPSPGYEVLTESWDGTSWAVSPVLATGRQFIAGAVQAPSSASLAFSGFVPGATSALTEEFNFTTNTITAAAWASGGALPGSGRQGYGVGTGTQTASIIAGGPPTSTQNEFYDGSAWTNLASIPSGVTNSQGFGDSEELLMAGGNTGAPYSALTYVYSRPGNSWTAVSSPGNINTARALGAGCGALSTAGIIAGGDVPGLTTATESWNGSAWTTVNALPTATGNGVGSCGTQTAGLIFSGENPGDSTAEETYEWDGTNWTSGGNRSTGVRAVRGGAGTQTAALTFGGWLDPGGSVSTEGYDGTSWSTRPNMAGAAANNFQTGTQTAALRAGGTDGPGYTAVEEFTSATSVAGPASNITTS